jgi:hypothetical protein
MDSQLNQEMDSNDNLSNLGTDVKLKEQAPKVLNASEMDKALAPLK